MRPPHVQHRIDEGFVEYRVTNEDGSSPSVAFETIEDAREAYERRLERYPEDGPQRVQRRIIGPWVNHA